MQVTDAAREWLSDIGFDPVYGARPLRRLVQTAIGDQLARDYDEYERETEEAGPVFQLIARYAF